MPSPARSLEERDDREKPGRVVSISLTSCGGPRISLEPGRRSHHGANRLPSSGRVSRNFSARGKDGSEALGLPLAGLDLLLAEGLWAPSFTGTHPLVTTVDMG